MQPPFALSMQVNCLTSANPLARTPMTVQKKVVRDSMIGGIVEYPGSQVLGAHGFARLFTSTRFKQTQAGTLKENFETTITFERDTFVETVMELMREFPDIPFYCIEDVMCCFCILFFEKKYVNLLILCIFFCFFFCFDVT